VPVEHEEPRRASTTVGNEEGATQLGDDGHIEKPTRVYSELEQVNGVLGSPQSASSRHKISSIKPNLLSFIVLKLTPDVCVSSSFPSTYTQLVSRQRHVEFLPCSFHLAVPCHHPSTHCSCHRPGQTQNLIWEISRGYTVFRKDWEVHSGIELP